MAKLTKRSGSGTYKSAGRTSDGVTILAPKTKPTHFTKGEMRLTIKEVRRDSASGRFETKANNGQPSRRG